MKNGISLDAKRTEPGTLSWLRLRSAEKTEVLLRSPAGERLRECGDDLCRALYGRLCEIAMPVLDVLYYSGDLGDDEALLHRGEALIGEVCPRLMDLIRQAEEDFSASLMEALFRLDACRDQIEDVLLYGKAFRQIRRIRFDCGDLHNHGRQVILFETDAGGFVYKPHALEADRVMRQLSETFFPGIFYVPRTVCGAGFGFCEYIENEPARTDDDARTYYRRLGGFCAVSRMLGSSDLHLQNFLSRDAMPVPVDHETAFSPVFRRQRELPKVESDLTDTLYGACLLPGWSFDCERSVLFDGSDRNVSAPVVGGRRETLERYLDSFLAGFCDVYRQGMAQRDALLAFAAQIDDFPVRAVPRATAGYVKLLRRSRTWKWLRDPGLGTEISRVLSASAVNGYLPGRGQVASETAAILRGDIPYFTVWMDGHDLCDPEGSADHDCISRSPREQFTRCLRLFSEQDLAFHCRLFRMTCAKVLLPRSMPEARIRSTELLSDAACIRRAEDVAEQILEELLPGPRGGLCCFTMLPGKEDAMEIAPYDLAHGRYGIGIFLSAMLKNSGNADLIARLRAALDGIASDMRDEADLLLDGKAAVRKETGGAPNGIAGYLFSAKLISCYSGNAVFRELYADLLRRVGETTAKLPTDAARDEMPATDDGSDSMLLPTDPLEGGSCAVIDALLVSGRTLRRSDLIQRSRALLTEMTLRADACGGYQLVPARFAPVRIPGLYSGLAGVGYTLLRQVDPELESVLPR